MKEKLLEKIRALFRLADRARGASPAEAELAMEKAVMLMTKHGIDKIEVEEKGATAREARSFNINERYYHTGRQRHADDAFIEGILRACFNVRVLWSSYYERVKGWRTNWEGKKVESDRLKSRLTYVLIGEPEDIEIAIIVIEELHTIMWHLYRAYLKDEGLPHKNFVFQSYFHGIQDGFINAAERGKRTALAAANPGIADQYAIVLVGKTEAITSYIQTNIKTCRGRSMKGGRAATYDGAYRQGFKDGQKIKVGQRKIQ